MTTRREQQLLERCLRLEAALAGVDVAPAEIAPARRRPRRTAIVVTPALVAEMQTMRSQGVPAHTIAHRLGCSCATVWKHTTVAQ